MSVSLPFYLLHANNQRQGPSWIPLGSSIGNLFAHKGPSPSQIFVCNTKFAQSQVIFPDQTVLRPSVVLEAY